MDFDWQPFLLSLKVAAAASLLAFLLGAFLAHAMTAWRIRGRAFIEALFLLPLVLPPVVTGYALLVMLGRQGAIGRTLEHWFGVRLLFTPYAAILAAATVAFPLAYQSAKAAYSGVDPLLEEVARSLGAKAGRVFWTITVPLAWPGLAAGAVLSFARALGEFGATIMVAGNIAGQTMTAPIAIYLAAEDGDMRLAGYYAALMAALNFVFLLSIALWTRRLKR